MFAPLVEASFDLVFLISPATSGCCRDYVQGQGGSALVETVPNERPWEKISAKIVKLKN
jgi:hypothetical protein